MKNRTLSPPTFISCALLFLCSYDNPNSESEDFINKKTSSPYDVIIVPGVPYKEPSFEIILKARILWAKYLYEHGIAKNIIFSGGSVYTPFVEGKIMKIYADSLGIPSEHTFSETRAEHSTENVFYSLQMAKKLGFKKIAVATDQYQAMIINHFIKKKCPEIKIVTIAFKKIDLKRASLPEIDPSSAYAESFVSLVKRKNMMQRFKGTMGKDICYTGRDSIHLHKKTPEYITFRK